MHVSLSSLACGSNHTVLLCSVPSFVADCFAHHCCDDFCFPFLSIPPISSLTSLFCVQNAKIDWEEFAVARVRPHHLSTPSVHASVHAIHASKVRCFLPFSFPFLSIPQFSSLTSLFCEQNVKIDWEGVRGRHIRPRLRPRLHPRLKGKMFLSVFPLLSFLYHAQCTFADILLPSQVPGVGEQGLTGAHPRLRSSSSSPPHMVLCCVLY